MKTTVLAASIALLCLAAGCGKPSVEETGTESASSTWGDPDLVLAESRIGPVTAADIDRYILTLPPAQRPGTSSEREEQFATIARRIAIDRLLLDEATLVGAHQDPEFLVLQRRIERNATSEHFLRGLPPAEPISEEEARAAYEQNIAQYQRQEARQVSHIYKRFTTDGERQQAMASLKQLRRQLLAGASFDLLAREHSESETRHNGGEIGTVKRGQFTADFDKVVFSLAERVPSEPVAAGDGAHIFLVSLIHKERNFDFEVVRSTITRELEAVRRIERLRDAALALPQPEGSFIPEPKELAQLLQLGDPAAELLNIGDFSLNLAQFQEFLQTQQRLLGAVQVPNMALLSLQEISHREIIYQHLGAEGLGEVPAGQLQSERDRELALHFARRKMSAWLEGQPELIQRHYTNNRMRFASPLRLHLRVLSIPLSGTGSDQGKRQGKVSDTALMAELETAKADLDTGTRQLEDLAAAYDGTVTDLGFGSAVQVQATVPRAMRFVFLLQVGEHSPPYARGNALVMFQVLERQDPQARPLALVRDQVLQDYLTHHSADTFEQLSAEILDEAGFKIYTERLARLGASQLGTN